MRRVLFTAIASLSAMSISAPAAAQYYGAVPSSAVPREDRNGELEAGKARIEVQPYIEAAQILVAEWSPGSDVVTYSQVAAGVDVSVNGRNNGGSVSVRYERSFANQADALGSSAVTGVARGYTTIIPQALTLEAGAIAARTRVDANGGNSLNSLNSVIAGGTDSRTYSIYAGPNVQTRIGPARVNAKYRIGYTSVEAPDGGFADGRANPVDVFDDSIVHNAAVHVATRPGDPLPVGLGIGAGWMQEDVANLKQRVHDRYVRGDVTVPLALDFALVGGIGYEDVEISSRDAVRDVSGNPVLDSNGRFVTDDNAPRQIAYEADGLIWDVGAIWRPSRRTAFEAHVGRRYDSATYYGSFAYAPSKRSSFGLSVYDGISGFGGLIGDALDGLPTQFRAGRNPLTGDLNGCVESAQGSNCLAGVLGSVRSSVFRSRGVAASHTRKFGRLDAGAGAGYDRRSFIGAPQTVLANADGVADENYYVTGFLGMELGRAAALSANAYANKRSSGFTDLGGTDAYGAAASYTRQLYRGLSVRGALAIDHFTVDQFGNDRLGNDRSERNAATRDITAASALVGLRYDF